MYTIEEIKKGNIAVRCFSYEEGISLAKMLVNDVSPWESNRFYDSKDFEILFDGHFHWQDGRDGRYFLENVEWKHKVKKVINASEVEGVQILENYSIF